MRSSTRSVTSRVAQVRCRARVDADGEALLHDRETRVHSYSYEAYRKARVLLIGAGGVGGLVALGLIRKGVASLTISDGDTVELPNLNRQRFVLDNLGKPKASELAKNLRAEAVADVTLAGINLFFEEALEEGLVDLPTLCVCAPDNDRVRNLAARYCFSNSIPMVTAGLSQDSDYGYIFAQDQAADRGCFGCLQMGRNEAERCSAAANINLPMLISGLILTACDSLTSGKRLTWNYRRLSLTGQLPDTLKIVPKWPGCDICGKPKIAEHAPCEH